MGYVPLANIPMFITAVFCITGTFMWSNLLINSKKFFICLVDPDYKSKARKQWYLIVLVFIHSLGTLACSFPNVLCATFPQACPTPYFHYASCGGYTVGQAMAQAVLAARLCFFQLSTKSRWLPYLCAVLVGARLIAGAVQCSISDFLLLPGWGYWVPIQSPRVLAAVYSLDFVNNLLFTSLFAKELYSHYRAIEQHSAQTVLYRMRQILQNAAVGGILAGIGTTILASTIISQTAKDEMQIVVIFSEIAWNSVIVTYIVNGNKEETSVESSASDLSPKKGGGAEMSLLTSASVFGARLEAPEPIAARKSPDQLRSFQYDHGEQNTPLSSKELLSGIQRVEEEYRLQLSASGDSGSGEKSGVESGEKSRKSEKSEEIVESPRDEILESPVGNRDPQDKDTEAMEVL